MSDAIDIVGRATIDGLAGGAVTDKWFSMSMNGDGSNDWSSQNLGYRIRAWNGGGAATTTGSPHPDDPFYSEEVYRKCAGCDHIFNVPEVLTTSPGTGPFVMVFGQKLPMRGGDSDADKLQNLRDCVLGYAQAGDTVAFTMHADDWAKGDQRRYLKAFQLFADHVVPVTSRDIYHDYR